MGEMNSRWYAATIQKDRNRPYGTLHAVEVGSRAAVCRVEAFPWFYWFDQPLDGLRVLPSGLCRECAKALVTAAKTYTDQSTNERG